MEKLCLLLVSCALWIVPVPAAAAVVDSQGKSGILANSVTQWTTIEINGILEREDRVLRPQIPEFGVWHGYGIAANGKWFGLEFVGDREWEKQLMDLTGKRVRVKGKVEERTLDGLIKHNIKVVVVSELDAIDLRESVHVELTGVFHVSAPITYLQTAPVVTVGGQTYVIDYEGAEGIFQAARKLDGKTVVLTGRLVGTTSFPVFCRCEPSTLPAIFLTGIKPADENAKDAARFTIQGKLKQLPLLPTDAEPLPGWSISANGKDYFVRFDDDKLADLAGKLDGKIVVLNGFLRTQECVDVNALGDPVIRTEIEVLRVNEL
jgi:hypothetical protein